ncbi:MAG: hypothetical protein LBP21_03410 [Synergistaceae bacterium]|jgi:hypothetical protein|nr:hypothetical protein [Synergistaceae bacterium]
MSVIDEVSEFTVGSVLSRTWRAMWKKPLAFMGLTLASEIVARGLFQLFLSGNPLSAVRLSKLTSDMLGGAIYLITTMLFQGTIIYTIFQLFMQDRASVWDSMTRSFSRVWAVLLATVVAMAAGCFVCLGTVFILTRPSVLYRMSAFAGGFVALLTALLLASFFFATWFVFAPACVVERIGALASLDRSGKLTKGYRLKILGILALLQIFLRVVDFIAGKVVPGSGIPGIILRIAIILVPVTFMTLVPAVVYYSLRVAKENLTPESLADIFD